jgi:3-oxoadipate enol-lactonase
MQALTRSFGALHVQVSDADGPGAEGAPSVLFINSLGTDLRLWDQVLPLLPHGLRFIRYDKRGHGLSGTGGGMDLDDHVTDAIDVINAIARKPVICVGLSIGGLIALCLAARRPDLVRALVLSNTAARLGTPESWQARMDAIAQHGLEGIADDVMTRWFSPAFRNRPEVALWRAMLTRTPETGYTAACAALATADQTTAARELRLPALVIAGDLDGATPPPIVQATAGLIPGSQFHVIPGAGHLPCVEAPAEWAALVSPFLKEHCHV